MSHFLRSLQQLCPWEPFFLQKLPQWTPLFAAQCFRVPSPAPFAKDCSFLAFIGQPFPAESTNSTVAWLESVAILRNKGSAIQIFEGIKRGAWRARVARSLAFDLRVLARKASSKDLQALSEFEQSDDMPRA